MTDLIALARLTDRAHDYIASKFGTAVATAEKHANGYLWQEVMDRLSAAREEGPRAPSDEPGDPALIKHLLDEMDAEAMPNERRAEILALKIRRATPTEAAEIPIATPSNGGGDWVMVPRDLVALFAEVADWYDARESDTFEVWLDYPHGMISRKHAQLRNYRRMAEALAAAPKHDGGEPVAMGHGRHSYCQPGDEPNQVWMLRFSDPDMRTMIWMDEDARTQAIAAWNKYSPAWNCYLFCTLDRSALSPTGGVKPDREKAARLAYRPISKGAATDVTSAWDVASRYPQSITADSVRAAYSLVDAILALPPSAPGEA